MRKYKIAICYDYSSYNGGGVARATFGIINELLNSGHKVYLIYKINNGITDKRINYIQIPFIRSPFINTLHYSLLLNKTLESIKPDLVITQCNTAPLSGKTYYKHIHIIHNLQGNEFRLTKPDLKYLGEFPIMYLLEKNNLKHSDKLYAVGESVKNDILQKYGIETNTVEWGVDLQKYTPIEKHNAVPRILSVSKGNSKRKNIQLLIEACKDLKIQLRITNLESTKKNTTINYLGYLSENDLINEYQHADLFVLPSSQESFGISTLEALACNIPVVLTRTGIWKDVQKANAGIITDFTIPSLRNGIIKALRMQFKNRPRKLAEKYSWLNTINTLLN